MLLPQSWQGPDLNYFVIRDFMESRRVRMLVIAAPAWAHTSDKPHVQLFRVVRYGDHPGALDGLGLRHRLAIYTGFVLGAPRNALSLLRPNLIDPQAGLGESHGTAAGYMGRPFVPHQVSAPAISGSALLYAGAARDSFRFDGPPLNAYQLHFIRKTAELARTHSTRLVILHLPSPAERGSPAVHDRQGMPSLLYDGVTFAGIPSAALFSAIPPAEFEDYYQDEHLNRNGMELFTQAITPALIEVYETYCHAR